MYDISDISEPILNEVVQVKDDSSIQYGLYLVVAVIVCMLLYKVLKKRDKKS